MKDTGISARIVGTGTVPGTILGSVPDPADPHVFGPPGSKSVSQRYGSGSGSASGSCYHQAKIVRKTLIATVL